MENDCPRKETHIDARRITSSWGSIRSNISIKNSITAQSTCPLWCSGFGYASSALKTYSTIVGLSALSISAATKGYLYWRASDEPSGGNVVARNISFLTMWWHERNPKRALFFAFNSWEKDVIINYSNMRFHHELPITKRSTPPRKRHARPWKVYMYHEDIATWHKVLRKRHPHENSH